MSLERPTAPVPRGILFDMDGVLVESTETWLRALQEASRRFGGREVTREEFLPTFGQGTAADAEYFGMQCTPAELDRAFLELFPRLSEATLWVDPDAASLLGALRAKGLRMSVVTNTMSQLADDILRTARLDGLFDAVVCADQVPHAKPAPDPLFEACRRLALKPEDVWMIGDSRFDAEAAEAAGVWFVGLRREGDVRLESLGDLSSLLP